MGTIEAIVAGVIALLAGLAGYFKVRGDQHKADAQKFKQLAENNAAASKAQADATEALQATAQKQQQDTVPPDTTQRDDLEGQL